MQESSTVRGVVHICIAAHMRTRAYACITQVVNYVTMRHPLVWRGAPYRRHRGTLRFAVGFG